MFEKISSALKWAGVVKHFHKNEFSEFLNKLIYYEDKFKLDYYGRALKGAALLMSGDQVASEKEFCKLIQDIGSGGSDRDKYISLYSQAIIDSINGREGAYAEGKGKAEKLNCGMLYRKMLPL